MLPAEPAAAARSLDTPSTGASARPARSPIDSSGTNSPPQPPAITAAVVAAARSATTASSVQADTLAVSAQLTALAPGPIAAAGVASRPITRTQTSSTTPPVRNLTTGSADQLRAL